jgi:hypothetical protein
MTDDHFKASDIDAPVETSVSRIFEAARQGNLVVCAGAGLSRAWPSELPSGAALGERLDDRLQGLICGYEPPADTQNLIAVADAGTSIEGGEPVLRGEVLGLADFQAAEPNYGHRAVAELLCEGGISLLLLWNWDDCIERVDVSPERLQVARTKADLDDLEQPSIAKIHGCATRKKTLLITSQDLDDQVPYWTDEAFKERLRGKTVVFVGVGDIADYARRRLEQLRDQLKAEGNGNEPDVWVVAPEIKSNWAASAWAELLPDLAENRRVEMTADEFLDQLGRRWVREGLDQLPLKADDGIRDEVRQQLDLVRRELASVGANRLMRWCRSAALGQRTGHSVPHEAEFKQLIVGFAVIAEESGACRVLVRDPAALEIGEKRLEALIICDPMSADRVRQRAQRRAEELSNQGTIKGSATFLVSGVAYGRLEDDPDSDLNLAVGPQQQDDLVAGTSSVNLSFRRASLLEEAA